MSRHEITTLALRLAAIYVCLSALMALGQFAFWLWPPVNMSDQMIQAGVMGAAATTILQLILGVVLFVYAAAVARKLCGGTSPAGDDTGAEIGALAFQIAGIVLLSDAVGLTTRVVQLAQDRAEWRSPFFEISLTTMILHATGGIALLVASHALARWLFRPRNAVIGVASDRLPHIRSAAFSVLGIWLLAISLPDLVVLGARYLQHLRTKEAEFVVHLQPIDAWTMAVRAALGLGLFLGARGLANGWSWIQRAGLALQRQRHEPAHREP